MTHYINPQGMPIVLHGGDNDPSFEIILHGDHKSLSIQECSGIPMNIDCADDKGDVITVTTYCICIELAGGDDEEKA